MVSVAPLCLPGGRGLATGPGAGPRVIPLVLSCGDEEEKRERRRQQVGDRRREKPRKVTYCNFHKSFPGPLRDHNHNILYPCG